MWGTPDHEYPDPNPNPRPDPDPIQFRPGVRIVRAGIEEDVTVDLVHPDALPIGVLPLGLGLGLLQLGLGLEFY